MVIPAQAAPDLPLIAGQPHAAQLSLINIAAQIARRTRHAWRLRSAPTGRESPPLRDEWGIKNPQGWIRKGSLKTLASIRGDGWINPPIEVQRASAAALGIRQSGTKDITTTLARKYPLWINLWIIRGQLWLWANKRIEV